MLISTGNSKDGVRVLGIMTREQVKEETLQKIEDLIQGSANVSPKKRKSILKI